MKTWSPKLRMLSVLGATRALVANSRREGWPDEAPDDCVVVLDQLMASIILPGEAAVPEFAAIYFLPTGPIQEIAISNGWHDAYMDLSSEYDDIEREFRLFPANNA